MTPYDEQREAEKLREYRRGRLSAFKDMAAWLEPEIRLYEQILDTAPKPESGDGKNLKTPHGENLTGTRRGQILSTIQKPESKE
jgi:hypothetical protein